MNMKKQFLFVLGLILGTSMLSGCAGRHGRHQPPPPEVPDAPAGLGVQPGQSLTLATKATGVQIYECGIDKNAGIGFTWIFKAPEAELFTARGKKIGKHYAGPTWEANDGSKVVGQLKASDKGPDAGAIPWLLLNAKSNSGQGLFAQTTSIQRLNTAGGKAPADGCDQAHLGSEVRVPYTAQYYFYNGSP
jgi:hypothetical protein